MRLAPVSWLSRSLREVTVKGFLCTDQQLCLLGFGYITLCCNVHSKGLIHNQCSLKNKAAKLDMFVGTMLTMVLLMRALDPLSHEKETELYLEKLSQVDCYRRGYYKDLSKYHPTLQITWGTGQWLLVRLTPWLSDWLADLMIGLTYWLTDWLTDKESDRLTKRATDWLTDWLTDWQRERQTD